MKSVGKRTLSTDLSDLSRLQRLAIKLRGDRPFIPRGVHRFKTFEAAQAWTFKMLTRKNSGLKKKK